LKLELKEVKKGETRLTIDTPSHSFSSSNSSWPGEAGADTGDDNGAGSADGTIGGMYQWLSR
jgi:hypothetical protein